jgi:hypothetical protein
VKWRVSALIVLSLIAAAVVTIWFVASDRIAGDVGIAPTTATHSADRASFDRWLAQEPQRAAEFAAFEAYIAREGVSDVLPAWKLTRANVSKSALCQSQTFILPPRNLWPNIVPALRVVRQHVRPAIGRIDVASVFRDPTLNACSRGARNSRHLTFAAVDLIPMEQPDAPTSFRRLCAAWRRAGAGSGWGLGAYYDEAKAGQTRIARFHVDGTGWRTWGFSYGRASSGCNAL